MVISDEIITDGSGLWTIIEPGEDEPGEAATANEKKTYVSRQGKAQARIALAICDEQQMHIRSLTTPKQIWEELQKLYRKTVNFALFS